MKQDEEKAIDEFAKKFTRSQISDKYCEFGETQEKEVKAENEMGTSCEKIRPFSFRNHFVKLVDLLNFIQTLHETEKQA